MARGTITKKGPQTDADANPAGEAMEQQVVAFAEQLGRMVGTVQAKAEGWLDPNALREQVGRIRDSATTLVQQLAAKTTHNAEPSASARGGRAPNTTIDRGRSGGFVDAPGKKHRKPTRDTPLRASAGDRGRVAKMKAVNSNRRRGPADNPTPIRRREPRRRIDPRPIPAPAPATDCSTPRSPERRRRARRPRRRSRPPRRSTGHVTTN